MTVNKENQNSPEDNAKNHPIYKLFFFGRTSRWEWFCLYVLFPSILILEILRFSNPYLSIIFKSLHDKITKNIIHNTPQKIITLDARSKSIDNNRVVKTKLSDDEIKNRANKLTVKIVVGQGAKFYKGSGIIIKKTVKNPVSKNQKNKYYILTVQHIWNEIPLAQSSVKVTTHDKKDYTGNTCTQQTELFKKYDLQVICFESDQEYSTGVITQNTIESWDKVYIFGYPCYKLNCDISKFISGNIGITHLLPDKTLLNKGYSIPYTNETESGMSGSPVLNNAGEIIAIHGLGKKAEPDIIPEEKSPYLLDDGSQLLGEKKEIMEYFSWGIDLRNLEKQLFNAL